MAHFATLRPYRYGAQTTYECTPGSPASCKDKKGKWRQKKCNKMYNKGKCTGDSKKEKKVQKKCKKTCGLC